MTLYKYIVFSTKMIFKTDRIADYVINKGRNQDLTNEINLTRVFPP
jgi:hypothetical protein